MAVEKKSAKELKDKELKDVAGGRWNGIETERDKAFDKKVNDWFNRRKKSKG